MRFKKYKCPGRNRYGCAFSFDLDEKLKRGESPCVYCGKTTNETNTVWQKINDFFFYNVYLAIPYDCRPKNAWYVFSCWAWKRYSTVKPRKLDHTWIDRSALIYHVVFEVLSDFVEKELDRVPKYLSKPPPSERTYTPSEEETAMYANQLAIENELREIHKWWTTQYNEEYCYDLSDEDFDKEFPWCVVKEPNPKNTPIEVREHEDATLPAPYRYRIMARLYAEMRYNEMVLAKAKRVIELSPHMWT